MVDKVPYKPTTLGDYGTDPVIFVLLSRCRWLRLDNNRVSLTYNVLVKMNKGGVDICFTYADVDRVRLEWMNRNIIRGNNFKNMVINTKDEVRGSRRIDKPQQVLFALLKDFAEDRLSFAFGKASGVRRAT